MILLPENADFSEKIAENAELSEENADSTMFCNLCAPHQIFHEQGISSAKSGELVYSGRLGASGYYYSSPVAADNKIYFASEEGVVVVLDADANLKILGANKLDAAILATPALVEGSI